MRTAIVTDTNSGISIEKAKELGIFIVPMPVIIGENTYLEHQTITHAELYRAMRQHLDISSSQPSPGFVTDLWDSILASGYDEIVYIPMSSGLSGSCQSAAMLAKDYNGKVFVVDNHRISVTQETSVYDAKHLAESGFSAARIKERLEKHAYDASIYISVDSLEYLKKGGRITPAAAAFATVINLKPVLTIQGDKLDSFAKMRGMKLCEKKMIEAMQKDIETRFSDIPHTQLVIATAGTFENPADAEHWRQTVQNAFPDYDIRYSPLSCSIACHTGINAAGAGVVRIEKR
ncbi:MAG: DegV family protein [Marvinbryantia sp.]|uniref:DegV family protein n=1 Tax=Marvinbryantia sp. TaxID=2496532 RepID=UPI0025F9CC70|nr:DegV family protein [uncultured Marvinbryantia sp.]